MRELGKVWMFECLIYTSLTEGVREETEQKEDVLDGKKI